MYEFDGEKRVRDIVPMKFLQLRLALVHLSIDLSIYWCSVALLSLLKCYPEERVAAVGPFHFYSASREIASCKLDNCNQKKGVPVVRFARLLLLLYFNLVRSPIFS